MISADSETPLQTRRLDPDGPPMTRIGPGTGGGCIKAAGRTQTGTTRQCTTHLRQHEIPDRFRRSRGPGLGQRPTA